VICPPVADSSIEWSLALYILCRPLSHARSNGASRMGRWLHLRSIGSVKQFLLLLVALLVAPTGAAAQGNAPQAYEIVLRTGFTGYSTGSDDGCQGMGGLLFGGSVKTPGAWLLGAGVDLVLPPPVACTLELRMHQLPDGRWYREDGQLIVLARLTFEAGRRVPLGRRHLDVAASGGAAVYDENSFVAPWTGALISYSGRRFGLRLEHGWHWVKVERILEPGSVTFEKVRDPVPATFFMGTMRVR
jgi:hypothetical protein